MSGTTKRLDLQFGSFACSVQGFDDPVQPVQQVLQAMQNMLEETPELGGSGLMFDAETIEQLTGEIARRADLDENTVEIVPGLVIVHRRGDVAEAGPEDDAEDETWARPFAAGEDEGEDSDDDETDTAEDGDDGYVNIFAAASGRGGAADDANQAEDGRFTDAGGGGAETQSSDSDTGGSFAARLEQIAAGIEEAPSGLSGDDAGRNIFAEPGTDSGGGIFADPTGTTEAANDGDAINLFAGSDADDDPDSFDNLFASANGDASDGEDTARGSSLFGDSDDQPEETDADEGYTAAGMAEAAGAKSVSDLMVSAAAWMVLIQGQTAFSRNDVIDVFQTIPGEHSKSLEARIKGFGRAVRNEQLIMIEDGVFGLARTELERFQRLL